MVDGKPGNSAAVFPTFLVKITEWIRLFRKSGLNFKRCLAYALSPQKRQHALTFELSFFPPGISDNLKVVIDIGANTGSWAKAALELFEIQQLLAFEPNPATFKLLESNIGGYHNVKTINKGLGTEKKRMVMNTFAPPELDSLLNIHDEIIDFYEGAAKTGTVEVEIERADDFFPEAVFPGISLIKMDVQGYEMKVFEGGKSVFGRTAMILIEILFVSHYERDSLFFELHDFLTQKLDFYLYNIGNFHRDEKGQILWGDALYINNRYKYNYNPMEVNILFNPSVLYTDT